MRVGKRSWNLIGSVAGLAVVVTGFALNHRDEPAVPDSRASAVRVAAAPRSFPNPPSATVGLECRPENTALVLAAVEQDGTVNNQLVPRWVPVARPRPPFGFVGCTPREFTNPDIDQGRAIFDLWGTTGPGSAFPVFSTDGELIGYSVSAAGFVPMNVIRQTRVIPPDVVARTLTYAEYQAQG